MNSLFLAILGLAAFGWGYLFFAKRFEQLLGVDPSRSTPAYSKYDSIDYVPAKNWLVLFGHHFSSIAGAGPVIGPVIAVMVWGWGPALLWIILGSIFIGGIHDFGSLFMSVREGGASVPDIAGQVISKKAKAFFLLFVWLTLILIIAVFAYLAAETFTKEPKIVLPSLGLIPVAMLVGYFLYTLRINSVLATAFGLVCLGGLLMLGNLLPVKGGTTMWIAVLLAYAYCASILPVNILLQPRDYLCSFLLFFGLGAGYVGLMLSRPMISMPPYLGWSTSEGYLWPALFVTVACGAVSGFHSLIASGTSSKQLANERYAKRIGYGAMVVEGMVAILALVCAALLFRRGENPQLLLKEHGPIGIFGSGFGLITQGLLGANSSFIAITLLNAFILTTLDTATRIARYLTEEFFGIKNRFLSTFVIIVLGAALALSGQWNRIWPAFGAANQLVAALTLFVMTCWLLSKKKPHTCTFVAGVFMLCTTLAALSLQVIRYIKNGNVILLIISSALVLLALEMAREVFSKMAVRRKYG
ncbi:MAG: carbon starvation protein A [Candidatus Omnitrophota bacterium]